MNVIGLLASTAVAYMFGQMLYAKWTSPYEGRHHTDTVRPVSRFYVPYDVNLKYPEMWRARIDGSAKLLAGNLKQVEQCHQESLIKRLANYGWLQYPTSDWPRAWRKAT